MAETKRTVSKTPQKTKMSDAEYAAQKRREFCETERSSDPECKEIYIQNFYSVHKRIDQNVYAKSGQLSGFYPGSFCIFGKDINDL